MPGTLRGDAARISQMVSNLLQNAVKYTDPDGEIALQATPAGSELVITVTDNGRGIAPEALPHVFDLFTQLDAGMDKGSGGLGVGLAIVKSLARLHGGSVEAHSDGLGRGARFTLRLPVASA